MTTSLSSLHLDGLDSSQFTYSDYDFPIPSGTRVVVVNYRTWGSSMYPTVYLYLGLQLLTGSVRTSYYCTPVLFSDVWRRASTFACKSITVIGDILRYNCNCPDTASGGSGINFTAYK